ncbi:hypothetical protein Tco_0285228 [Tanacetum coccineum]
MTTEMELTLEQTQQGGRFYILAGNPIKEILLKLNLPDHRKLKDGGVPDSSCLTRFIATCSYPTDKHKDIMKAQNFQRSFCHSDTERLSRSDEVLKLKNFKKDATLKLFKSTNQVRCSRSHIHIQVKIRNTPKLKPKEVKYHYINVPQIRKRKKYASTEGRPSKGEAESNVVNHSETEITSDSKIIPYSQYVIESQQAAVQNSNSSAQQDALILSVIEQLKSQVVNCTKINLENKSVNDTLTAELERYKEQVKVLKEGQNVDLRSNNNVSDSSAQSVEIDRLKQTLSEHLKEKESLMQHDFSSQR